MFLECLLTRLYLQNLGNVVFSALSKEFKAGALWRSGVKEISSYTRFGVLFLAAVSLDLSLSDKLLLIKVIAEIWERGEE